MPKDDPLYRPKPLAAPARFLKPYQVDPGRLVRSSQDGFFRRLEQIEEEANRPLGTTRRETRRLKRQISKRSVRSLESLSLKAMGDRGFSKFGKERLNQSITTSLPRPEPLLFTDPRHPRSTANVPIAKRNQALTNIFSNRIVRKLAKKAGKAAKLARRIK